MSERRYVIIANEPSAADADAITKFIRDDKDVSFWHWFNAAWLLVDNRDDRDAAWWRDQLSALRRCEFMVLRVNDPQAWAGVLRGGHLKTPWLKFRWIHNTAPPEEASRAAQALKRGKER